MGTIIINCWGGGDKTYWNSVVELDCFQLAFWDRLALQLGPDPAKPLTEVCVPSPGMRRPCMTSSKPLRQPTRLGLSLSSYQRLPGRLYLHRATLLHSGVPPLTFPPPPPELRGTFSQASVLVLTHFP